MLGGWALVAMLMGSVRLRLASKKYFWRFKVLTERRERGVAGYTDSNLLRD